MRQYLHSTTYFVLLGATLGLGTAWWIKMANPEMHATPTWLVGQIAVAIVIFQAFRFLDLERFSPSGLAAFGMILCEYILEIIWGIEPVTALGWTLIGGAIGFVLGLAYSLTKRKSAVSIILSIIGSGVLVPLIWRYPDIDQFALAQVGIVFVVPAFMLSVFAPTLSLATMGRSLAVCQVISILWLATLAGMVTAQEITQIPDVLWLSLLLITIASIVIFRLPGWQQREWVWWGPTSAMFFPFRMPKANEQESFHLVEKLGEPTSSVNGTLATVWVYRKDGQITRLILTGHSNLPVCREISAKMFTALIELAGKVTSALFVPGAFEVSVNPTALPQPILLQTSSPSPFGALPPQYVRLAGPLDELFEQLGKVRNDTGLVEIREMGEQGNNNLEAEVLQCIDRYQKTGEAKVYFRARDAEPAGIALLPVFDLAQSNAKPLSVDLPLSMFGERDLNSLMKIQHESLINEITGDARRRKQVYEEWMEKDKRDLQQIAHQVIGEIATNVSTKQMMGIIEDLIEQTARAMKAAPTNVTMDGLAQFLSQQKQVAARISVRKLIETHIHKLHLSDSQWENRSAPFKERMLPIQGSRNYLEATIGETGQILGHISMLELVEGHLPGLIQSDTEWISRMDELLNKYDKRDHVREARIETINLATMLDSFLRGWPSYFLEGERAQEAYRRWCKNNRERVWREIHSKLRATSCRIDPLLADNMVFHVDRLDNGSVRIKPLFITTDKDLMFVLSKSIGLVNYIYPWQYRKRVWVSGKSIPPTLNSRRSEQLCISGIDNLNVGNTEAALACFREALNAHPVAGTVGIFSSYWKACGRDSHRDFEKISSLVQAVKAFNEASDRSSAVKSISDFAQSMPDYLPDTYLMASMDAGERKLGLGRLRAQFQREAQSCNQEIEALIKEGILVPESSEPGTSGQGTSYRVHINPWDTQSQKRLEELKRRKDQLDRQGEELKTASQRLWALLKSSPDEFMARAMLIGPRYVTRILNEESFFPSEGYVRRVVPVYAALQGSEYLKLYLTLAQNTRLLDNLKENLLELRRVVSEAQKTSYIDSSQVGGLVDLAHTLDAMNQPDSIEREMVLRHKLDMLRQNYIRNAYRQFIDAMALAEFTEVRHGFVMCFYYMAQYRQAIEWVTKPDSVPLLAAFPWAKLVIMDTKPHPIASVTFESTSRIVNIVGPNGDSTPIMRIDGLSDLDSSHLATQVSEPSFISWMQGSPLTPAYSIPSVPIAPSPTVRAWRSTITALEPWLLRASAYLYLPPVPDQTQKDDEANDKLNKIPILDRVVVDYDLMIESILDQYDPRRRHIAIQRLDSSND